MSAFITYDFGEYPPTLEGPGVLHIYDLSESERIILGEGTFGQYDFTEFRVVEWGGVLGQYDFGEYPMQTQSYGILGQYDLGDIERVYIWGGILGQYDLGDYERVLIWGGVLGQYDFGEFTRITIGPGVLGQYDFGEYSYILLEGFPEGEWFPTELVGKMWAVNHKPEFNTGIRTSLSGREFRTKYREKPLWYTTFGYDYLRDIPQADHIDFALNYAIQRLTGFFMKMRGSFSNFLMINPMDHEAIDQVFAYGDGVTSSFQLTRTYGASGFEFTEKVQNVQYLNDVKINGLSVNGHVDSINVTNNPCVVDTFGIATFRDPPPYGATLAWSGIYFYRYRFVDDVAEFINFMDKLWRVNSMQLVGSPENIL